MRICEVTCMHDADDDRIYQRACLGLAREGHEVVLIAEGAPGKALEGVAHRPLTPRRGLRRRVFSAWEAYRLARREDADVFHFHDPELLLPMLLLASGGRRVVYDVHENYASRITRGRVPGPLVPLIRAAWRAFELTVVRRLSGVIAVTESMGDLYRDHARRQIVVLNTVDPVRLGGVDLDQPKDPRPVLLISGTHSRARNCLQAVEALPLILEKVPDAVLRFLGRYHPQGFAEELAARAAALEVTGHVELEGMIPWEENFARAARAHVGCVFYADTPNNRVGLPNRLFEYMFCGLPVLAEDFPELRRVIAETGCGVVVDSSSPRSIATGAVRLLADPEEACEMGRRGRHAVLGQFSFPNEVRRMVELFESLGDDRGLADGPVAKGATVTAAMPDAHESDGADERKGRMV